MDPTMEKYQHIWLSPEMKEMVKIVLDNREQIWGALYLVDKVHPAARLQELSGILLRQFMMVNLAEDLVAMPQS